jgi:hypothetical protein
MGKSIEVTIYTLSLIKEGYEWKERELLDKGSYGSAAVYTGKVAAINDIVAMLEEVNV